jgi:hypothetical protein
MRHHHIQEEIALCPDHLKVRNPSLCAHNLRSHSNSRTSFGAKQLRQESHQHVVALGHCGATKKLAAQKVSWIQRQLIIARTEFRKIVVGRGGPDVSEQPNRIQNWRARDLGWRGRPSARPPHCTSPDSQGVVDLVWKRRRSP